MIAYLEGKLTYKSPTCVYLDIGGIAYDVQISLNTYAVIEQMDQVKLYTQLIVREDAHTLFGFVKEDERDLFNQLISVSGVGPNTARMILSYMTAAETAQAILHDDVVAFKKVKGVGPKTAKRIILDLKDKMSSMELEADTVQVLPGEWASVKDQAVSALVALGFQKARVVKEVEKVMNENPEEIQVENLIKSVLRQLS
ncbi:MAG: Holliday junction branch migration protein RuvA [Saprospiraceae bacterium]